MSRLCLLTGKRPNSAQARSHSNRSTKRRQLVNLQVIRFDGKKTRIAARTLRTLKKFSRETQQTKQAIR